MPIGAALGAAFGAAGDIAHGMIKSDIEEKSKGRLMALEEARDQRAYAYKKQFDVDLAETQRVTQNKRVDDRRAGLLSKADSDDERLRKFMAHQGLTDADIEEVGGRDEVIKSLREGGNYELSKREKRDVEREALQSEMTPEQRAKHMYEQDRDESATVRAEHAARIAELKDDTLRMGILSREATANRGLDMRADGTYGAGRSGDKDHLTSKRAAIDSSLTALNKRIDAEQKNLNKLEDGPKDGFEDPDQKLNRERRIKQSRQRLKSMETDLSDLNERKDTFLETGSVSQKSSKSLPRLNSVKGGDPMVQQLLDRKNLVKR